MPSTQAADKVVRAQKSPPRSAHDGLRESLFIA